MTFLSTKNAKIQGPNDPPTGSGGSDGVGVDDGDELTLATLTAGGYFEFNINYLHTSTESDICIVIVYLYTYNRMGNMVFGLCRGAWPYKGPCTASRALRSSTNDVGKRGQAAGQSSSLSFGTSQIINPF